MKIIDFSSKFPSGKAIRRGGYDGVVAYVSPPREGWMKGKPINPSVYKDYKRNGLKIAFVWQFGKEASPDVMRGYNGGVSDARNADKVLKSIGAEGHPVIFAVDFDINLSQWNNTAVEYFKGAISVLGIERVGIYGHSKVVSWAKEDNVVARIGDGRVLGWVTKAWSDDDGRTYASMYQHTFNTDGPEGVKIDISSVYSHYPFNPVRRAHRPLRSEDSRVESNTMRQNKRHRGDPLFLPEVLRAVGVPYEEYGDWKNIGHGDFGEIKGVFWHHTGTTRSIPGYIQNHPQLGLCSQMHLDRSGKVQIVGAGLAYHAGLGRVPGTNIVNNANQYYIGIEASSDGKAPWSYEQMNSYRRMTAGILYYLGLDATPQTMVAHHEYAGVAQGKWDPGENGRKMDMNRERAEVQKIINQLKSRKNAVEEMTPQERKMLNDMARDIRDVKIQLLGATQDQRKRWGWALNRKGGIGWPQLGTSKDGKWLTLVDAVASLKKDIAEIKESMKKEG